MMKKGLKWLVLTVIAVSMLMMNASVFAIAKNVSISVDSAKGNPGSVVKLTVKLSNAPKDGITGGQFRLKYNKERFKLVKKVKAGPICHNPTFDIYSNESLYGTTVVYADYDLVSGSAISKDGVFCTAEFEINKNCPAGVYPITLEPVTSYNAFTKAFKTNPFYSGGSKTVNVKYTSGTITVSGSKKPAKSIKMTVGNKEISINGAKKAIAASPVQEKGKVLVPVKAFISAYGGKISESSEQTSVNGKKVTTKVLNVKIGSKSYDLKVGKYELMLDKKMIVMENTPKLIGTDYYLPMDELAAIIGFDYAVAGAKNIDIKI